jgi:hypothetical protein
MIDDQVNAEEVAEKNRQREAAQNATNDGMPITPALEAVDDEDRMYRGMVGIRKKSATSRPKPLI